MSQVANLLQNSGRFLKAFSESYIAPSLIAHRWRHRHLGIGWYLVLSSGPPGGLLSKEKAGEGAREVNNAEAPLLLSAKGRRFQNPAKSTARLFRSTEQLQVQMKPVGAADAQPCDNQALDFNIRQTRLWEEQ